MGTLTPGAEMGVEVEIAMVGVGVPVVSIAWGVRACASVVAVASPPPPHAAATNIAKSVAAKSFNLII